MLIKLPQWRLNKVCISEFKCFSWGPQRNALTHLIIRWMLHILACKMRFKYCFSLSSSFLSFICFIFMLFFRSKRIEASSIVFFLGLFTFELLTLELFIEKMFYFFELDLCHEFLWLQHRFLSELWIGDDLTNVFYY